MTENRNRFLSLLLVLLMCLSLFPAQVFAEDAPLQEEILEEAADPLPAEGAAEDAVNAEPADTDLIIEEEAPAGENAPVEEEEADAPEEDALKTTAADELYKQLKAAIEDPNVHSFDLIDQGEFEIQEDLVSQGGIFINTRNTTLVIPSGVKLTVHQFFGTGNLRVDGEVSVEGGRINVNNQLVLNGKLSLDYGQTDLPADAFDDKAVFEKVSVGESSHVCLQYHTDSEAGIFSAMEAAKGLPQNNYNGEAVVHFAWEPSRDVTFDDSFGLLVSSAGDGSVVVPKGRTLTVNSYVSLNGAPLTVRGTFVNNSELWLQDNGGKFGTMVIDGGSYSGLGKIYVPNTVDPATVLIGLDITKYQSETKDNWIVLSDPDAVFAALKQACADASAGKPGRFTLLSDRGTYTIPESITIPSGLQVDTWNTVLTVPSGVTLTVQGQFIVHQLVVENGGQIVTEKDGNLWIDDSLDLKGKITATNTWVGMPADSWNDGMMGTAVVFNGNNAGVKLIIHAGSVEDIYSAPEKYPIRERVRPNLKVEFPWTLTEDFSFPNGVEVHVQGGDQGGSVTVPAGKTLESNDYFGLHQATMTVQGKLKNNGFLDVRQDGETHSRIVMSGGSYEGTGDICVRDAANVTEAKSYLAGFDFSLFNTEEREDGVYFWMGEPDWTFADLEEACGKSYEPGAEDSFIAIPNRSRFTIEKDLTIPCNMTLHDHEGEIYVPEGVTLTVLGRMECGWLTVDGTVILTGGSQTEDEFMEGGYLNVFGDTLGGKGDIQIRSCSHMDVNTESWKDGDWIDHLVFDRDNAWATVWYDVEDKQQAINAVHDVTALNDHIDRSLNILFGWTLDKDLEIPDDMHVEVRGQDGAELTIPGNVTLTVNNRLVVQGADIYVNGTLVNRDVLQVERDWDNTRLGKVTFSKSGTYSGEGRIWVDTPDEADARACLPGLDLSGFAVSEQDGGTLFTDNDDLFAALKAAAAAGDQYFTLHERDRLVIPEDFTVPESLTVSFWNADGIVIPKGVTLTVRGGMHGNSLTVGGTVEVRGRGDINVHEIAFTDENASLNLKDNGTAFLPVEVWSDAGKDHIALSGASQLFLCMNAWSMEQLINECTPQIGEPEPHVKYWIVILFDYVAESAEPVELGVLENVVLEFYKGDSEDENGSMTVGKNVSYAVDGELIFNGASTLTVQGTVVNNNWIQLVGDEKEGYGSIVLEKGAVYDGEGGIWVGKTQNAESRLIGFREYQPAVYQELMAGKQVINNGTQFTRSHEATEAVTDFVRRGYQIMLGRPQVSQEELDYYVNPLKAHELSAAQMIVNFLSSGEFADRGLSYEEVVTITYQTMMNREPDPDGLKYHAENLRKGISYNALVNNFTGSDEFKEICEKAGGIEPGELGLYYRDQNLNVTAFIIRNYELGLGRAREQIQGDELEYHARNLLTHAATAQEVASQFVLSDEAKALYPNDRDFIVMLYHLYMDRDPGEEEIGYYIDRLATDATRESLAAFFGSSEEFQAIVASYGL